MTRRHLILHKILRALGRLPVPGVFPLVIDPLHKRFHRGPDAVQITAFGALVDLDLNDYVQRRIFYGCFEPELLEFARQVLQAGDVVVDVGANIGFLSLAFARAVGPTGIVHSIEPVPGNLARLRTNTRAVSDVVHVHPCAVGDHHGTVDLGTDVSDDGTAGESGNYRVGGSFNVASATIRPLDDVVSGVAPIRLLKIDTEGYEPNVLQGARALLRGPTRPAFVVCELNADQLIRTGHDLASIAEPLADAGYELFVLRAGGRLVSASAFLSRASHDLWPTAPTLRSHAWRYLRRRPTLATLVATAGENSRFSHRTGLGRRRQW